MAENYTDIVRALAASERHRAQHTPPGDHRNQAKRSARDLLGIARTLRLEETGVHV